MRVVECTQRAPNLRTRTQNSRQPAPTGAGGGAQGVDYEDHRARLLQNVALRDISSPQDVANFALFLVSDESRTITGQSIPVGAGGYMQG